MNKYQDKLSGFAERMKSEENLAPIQEVKPIGKKNLKQSEKEVQLNVWIPKSLMKKIKQKSLNEDISIKDFVTKGIMFYLNYEK